jgi:hypothetical protein
MKENYKRLIEQIAKSTAEGIFGDAALSSSKEYEGMPLDTSRLSKFIKDLSTEISSGNEEEVQPIYVFWQILVVVYRDSKKVDAEVAKAFLHSFIEDYPDMPNTALSLRWNSLAQAIFAFKSVAHSNDPLLVWQQASRLFLDYSEFLNGLLGYLTIAWKCALKKNFKPNVFNAFYAVKAKQFEELTNGDNGVFDLFNRMIKPKLRNGIAHGNSWPDWESNKVRYTDGKTEDEYDIDFSEFLALCMLGSHLAKSYIAAMATIVIWEEGTEVQKLSLPQQFIKLLTQ